MEKEVTKWLHQQFGYNAAADSTLSANCRGNLKTLWEFLMTNYKTSENQRHIHNVLSKHRREQEMARLAPARRQQALLQKQYLLQLETKAAELKRTLVSFQVAVDNSIQDATEQHGEQAVFKQDLRGLDIQAMILQSASQRTAHLLPQLQAKLSKLQSDAELAKTRCHTAGGNRRLQHVQQQLCQLSSTIREELMQVLESKLMQLQQQHGMNDIRLEDHADYQSNFSQQSATARTTLMHQPDEASSMQQNIGTAVVPQSTSGSMWQDLNLASSASAEAELLNRCSLMSSYSPSQAVKSSALQLLQEAPELLLTGSSQLAAHSSHQLNAILNEAETALLAPLSWGAAGQDGGSQSIQQQLQGLMKNVGVSVDAQASSCPYTLPWMTQWQSGCTLQPSAAFHSPETLVKERQKMHMQLFVQTKAAQKAAAAADQELTQLLGSTTLLRQGLNFDSSSWETQLAGLWLQAEGLRAEVALQKQRKAQFEHDVDECLQAEVQLQDKWVRIEAAVAEDQELNHLLWQVAADNMELYAALCSQQDQVLGLLRGQFAPSGAAASSCAIAGRDGFPSEVGLVGKLPLAGALPPRCIAADQPERAMQQAGGASTATTMRLQLAAQQLSHLGRPTTAPKAFATAALVGAAGAKHGMVGSSSGSNGADAAAVSALRAASDVDAVAPARCPAALLSLIAEEYQQHRQQQQLLEQLNKLWRGASGSAKVATEHAEQLQKQVDGLRARDQQEVLPWLHEKLDYVQQQRVLAQQDVAMEVAHGWDMPAQHLLPNKKYEGRSCSDWLAQIQALHGKKSELKNAAIKSYS